MSEPEFWRMTHAQFLRQEKAWFDRREARFYDMYNAIGMAWHGKDWKYQKPGGSADSNVERVKAAMAALEERRRRKRNG